MVTGGNSGIGEAVAHQLTKQPDYHVVIAARNLEASAKVVADLLDVLVNDAGGGVDQVPGLTTREIFTQDFDLNVTGPAILTDASCPSSPTQPRLELFSSGYEAKGYGSSKAALSRVVGHYSRLLTDAGGLANAVCPGFVKTKKLTGFAEGSRTPEQAAKKIVEMALLREKGPTATFTMRMALCPGN